MTPGYDHTQKGPLWLLPVVLVIVMVIAAGFADAVALRYTLVGFGLIFALIAACFANLTVRDGGDHLEIRYGPLRWWGTKVRYDAITRVEPTRSRLIDGLGIHWIPGRGWTFNLWGFDCVEVTTTKGVVRIGTDDRDGLTDFLAARLAAQV